MLRIARLAAFLIIFVTISCSKKKQCFATVVCKDSTGNGMDSVLVELYSYVKKTNVSGSTESLVASGITGETGRISFAFNAPAVYTVRAAKNAQSGSAVVQLTEGKEIQKDITLP